MIKNTVIILICSILVKILSYIWEALIASYLGISDNADAFYMSTGIINVLYPMLDLGIWKVFMPIYKQSLSLHSKKRTDKIANISITLFLCFSVILVLFFVFFAEPLVVIMAPGFSVGKKIITVEYLRIAAIAYLLMAVATVISVMLQSHERFIGYQMRELMNHLSKIVYVILCYKYLGIYAIVTAIIVGGVFRLFVQIPFINWPWIFRFNFNFGAAEIRPMLKGLPSVAVTTAISHINSLVGTMFASTAVTGAIACLNYGNKLMNVFSGMLSGAIATATYPKIIQFIAEKRDKELSYLISNIVAALSFTIIPISMLCGVYSKVLVEIAFQRGSFDIVAVELTSNIFAINCIGMLFWGLTTMVTNIFYAFGDTRITFYISLVHVFLNFSLNFLLFPVYGVVGVAISASLSVVLCFFIRVYFLKFYVKVEYNNILSEIIKIVFISLIAVSISRVLYALILQNNIIIKMFCVILVIMTIYIGLAYLLRVKVLLFLKKIFFSKLNKRKTRL